MEDFLFQALSTVQSDKQLTPKRIASAATIAPDTFLTFVSGVVQVADITPPIDNMHLLALVFTDADPGAFTGAGNVLSTKDPAQNELVLLCYDPVSAKYYVCNP